MKASFNNTVVANFNKNVEAEFASSTVYIKTNFEDIEETKILNFEQLGDYFSESLEFDGMTDSEILEVIQDHVEQFEKTNFSEKFNMMFFEIDVNLNDKIIEDEAYLCYDEVIKFAFLKSLQRRGIQIQFN